MWIFLNDAFLSVVAHRHEPDMLLVRARARGDIERVFPDADVSHSPDADYAYRATLAREVVARVLAEQVAGITYPNFKSSIKEPDRHDACMAVWSVMHRFQTDRARG
jgi:hypothetical protein